MSVVSPAPASESSDAGFTLLELVITLVLMGLILGAIAAMFVVSFLATSTSAKNVDSSHDRQLSAVYLAQDIASAATATAQSTANLIAGTTLTATCPVSGLNPAPTVVLDLQWQGTPPTATTLPVDPTSLIVYYAVDYGVVQSGTQYNLVRYYCSAGRQAGPYSLVTTQPSVVVAYNVPAPTATTYPVAASVSNQTITVTITDSTKKTFTITNSMGG